MIIVTGTKRSGTSMWMQVLKEAGLPVLGDAFPAVWNETIKDANPRGFYESPLRNGIYYATNPHPVKGVYLHPEKTRRIAVKVFIPGLVRSDMAFIHQVVATMRDWREYGGSLTRLYEMEDENLREMGKRQGDAPLRLSPVLEWWLENFMLIRDVATRGYPIQMQSYQRVLEDPEAAIAPVLQWLGAPRPADGLAVVDDALRTQKASEAPSDVAPEHARVFDELYDCVHRAKPLTEAFLSKLNETHEVLVDAIEDERESVRKDHQLRRQRRRRALLKPDVLRVMQDRVESAARASEPPAEPGQTDAPERDD